MDATLRAVQPYELHGTLYYRLIYQPDGRDQLSEARLSHDMVYADPREGDRISIHALLGIVDRVDRLDPPA